MDELKKDTLDNGVSAGSNATGSSVLVKTLDGKMVPKDQIAEGEIYINADGKKVRKVVKKVVKKVTKKVASASASAKTEDNMSNILNEVVHGSADAKNENDKSATKNEQAGTQDNKIANSQINSESPNAENLADAQEVKPAISSLRERLNAKHAFLLKLETNERISPVSAVANKPADGKPAVQGTIFHGNGIVEESIEPDGNVKNIEEAVLTENLNNSIGLGSSLATSDIVKPSNVSGAAYNPNGSVLNNPLSNADNIVSKSLTGSFVASGLATPIVENKKKKEKKRVNPLVAIIPLVAIYLVAALVYFFTCYNFSDKSVNVGLYYVNIGQTAKREYYDGEKFNFNDMLMTYYYGDENIDEYDLSKYNMVEPTASMGYTVNNGYISAIWTGAYANATSRTVDIKFLHEGQTGYIEITIFRNVLESLNTYSVVSQVSAGAEIDPVVFGVYTNQVMVDEGIGSIERRMEENVEYYLVAHLKGSKTVDGKQYFFDIDSVLQYDSEKGVYTLPSIITGVAEDSSSRDDIEINYINTEVEISAVSRVSNTINCVVYKNHKISSGETNYSTCGYKITDITGNNINFTNYDIKHNQTFKFKVALNEGYTIFNGVEYLVDDENPDTEDEYVLVEPNENGVYTIERGIITNNLKIKANVTNGYVLSFNNGATEELRAEVIYGTPIVVDEDDLILTGAGRTFNGWFTEAVDGVKVFNADGTVVNNVNGITDADGNFIITANMNLYAQFNDNTYSVNYANEGFRIYSGVDDEIVNMTHASSGNYAFFVDALDGYKTSTLNSNLNNTSSFNYLYRLEYSVNGTDFYTLTGVNRDGYYYYSLSKSLVTNSITFRLNLEYSIVINNNINNTNIGKVTRGVNATISVSLKDGFYFTEESGNRVYYRVGNGSAGYENTLTYDSESGTYSIAGSELVDTLYLYVDNADINNTYLISAENAYAITLKTADGTTSLPGSATYNSAVSFTVAVNAGYTVETLVISYSNNNGENFTELVGVESGELVVYTIPGEAVTSDIIIRATGITANNYTVADDESGVDYYRVVDEVGEVISSCTQNTELTFALVPNAGYQSSGEIVVSYSNNGGVSYATVEGVDDGMQILYTIPASGVVGNILIHAEGFEVYIPT